jgi:5-methylcytosine-specific restriction endonuclease McrA
MLLWTRIRAEVLWENKLCQKCGVRPSSEVDHIREIALGGDPFDKANLQALCRQCHREKTVRFLVEEMGKKGRIGKRLAKTRIMKQRTQLENVRRPYNGASTDQFFAIAEQSSIEDF